jgi:hypothetical protein
MISTLDRRVLSRKIELQRLSSREVSKEVEVMKHDLGTPEPLRL